MKKIRQNSKEHSFVNLIDRSEEHCLNIMAVAELLRCCNVDDLQPKTIADASQLLFHEAKTLLAELDVISLRC